MGITISAKEGLLALSVNMLKVLQALMEEEVTELVGPKGKHNPSRSAVRHGYEKGSVVLGGRRVRVKRPRVRSLEGKELPINTYITFQREDHLGQGILERMLHGLSTRNYSYGLEPCGSNLATKSTSKNSISRRFIERTKTALAELLSKPLENLDIPILFIDSVVVAEHTVTVALGIDSKGYKHILGLEEGATENATVCKNLLSNLMERGLTADEGLLTVIDGSKALRRAIKDAFGDQVLIQRCRVHKKRNVLDHLPKEKQLWIAKKLDEAWKEKDPLISEQKLKNLALSLEKSYPGAANSLREGLQETLTLQHLQVPEKLQKSLKSTNIIESAFDLARSAARNVKRWQNGEQVLRWSAAGLLEAEKRFHRIEGYRELPLLKTNLQQKILKIKEVVSA